MNNLPFVCLEMSVLTLWVTCYSLEYPTLLAYLPLCPVQVRLSSGPSTLGGPAQVPNPIPYRLERNEQERERNLQSRYQVSAIGFFTAGSSLDVSIIFSLRHYSTSTKDYEFVIRNFAIALQNWNLTPPVLVRVLDPQQQQQQQLPFISIARFLFLHHLLLSLQLLLPFLLLPLLNCLLVTAAGRVLLPLRPLQPLPLKRLY